MFRWILHPLKSELNWPLGVREPLDLTYPVGLRWQLPWHLCDAVLQYQNGGKTADDWSQSLVALEALRDVTAAIDDGIKARALLATPAARVWRLPLLVPGGRRRAHADDADVARRVRGAHRIAGLDGALAVAPTVAATRRRDALCRRAAFDVQLSPNAARACPVSTPGSDVPGADSLCVRVRVLTCCDQETETTTEIEK
jgi:hypothetical protein